MDYVKAAVHIHEAVEASENIHDIIGEITLQILQKDGFNGIKRLHAVLSEGQGTKRSVQDLYQHAWVWQKTLEYKLPTELSYTLRRTIAGRDNIEKYVEMIKSGASRAELYQVLHEEQPRKERKKLCPQCGTEMVDNP